MLWQTAQFRPAMLMSPPNSNLLRLVDLAREPSSEKRRELLREMTDLFLERPGEYSENETNHFGDILGVVAKDMEMAVRQALAAKLALVPTAPRSLIIQLANDEIDVAKPVLSRSLALRDSDLLALARVKGQNHLRAIAARDVVSEELSDALVERGDDDVLAELAGNEGARLSRRSLETMTDRALTSQALHKPMVSRSDLPPDLLNSMFFAVSSELKRAIMARMQDLDPEIIDSAIRQTERRMKMQTATPDPDQAKADAFMDTLKRSGPVTEAMLVTFAQQKRLGELAIVFAKLADLDLKTARRVLADPNPEALAIVCRACRFDRQTFSTLALSRADEARSVGGAFDLLSLYDKVPPDAAQRVIRFWRVRTGATAQAA